MSGVSAAPEAIDTSGETARRTAPLSVLVGTAQSVQSAIFPALVLMVSMGGSRVWIGLAAGLALAALGSAFAYLSWRRLTYTIRDQDIRVESGVLSRSARSVPYERIQDVSLEQKFVPRLFGLVAVKFETGAGGGEDLSLAFLEQERGEELRRLVRERRDEGDAVVDFAASGEAATVVEEPSELLFAMDPRRLFTFGLFEFSLAVFAVLGGLAQYADTLVDFEIWDPEVWEVFLSDQANVVAALGPYAQVAGALLGLTALFLIGSATGMIRVFAREWNFTLERTARGFRRRRGLFTRTDVVMPIHRVQGVVIATRMVRRLFGWESLRFVSLAQDAAAASHVVAPFAHRGEIEPIVEAAGFHVPGQDADWRRASKRSLIDGIVIEALVWLILGVGAWFAARNIGGTAAAPWVPLAIGLVLALAALSIGARALAGSVSATRSIGTR